MALNNVGQNQTAGFDKCKSKKITLSPNVIADIFPANSNRVYAILANTSAPNVSLLFVDPSNALSKDGIPLIGKGSSYEIGQMNLYLGKVSAISSNTAELSVVECER